MKDTSILKYKGAVQEVHAFLHFCLFKTPNPRKQKAENTPKLHCATKRQFIFLMGEVVLLVNDFHKVSYCRICHEAEFESCKRLEAPCACSGTVKFAHRECIQRWCDEKGNTVCEICLQKYESGYTSTPKQPKRIVVHDEVVNIRGSLEIPRAVYEFQNSGLLAMEEFSAADRSASCCRTLALIFTALLLMRHLLDVLTGGAQHYPFSLVTILLLRTCGIAVPMYIIIQTITALRNSIRRHCNLHDTVNHNANNRDVDQARASTWQR